MESLGTWFSLDEDEQIVWASNPSRWPVYYRLIVGGVLVILQLLLTIFAPGNFGLQFGPIPLFVALSILTIPVSFAAAGWKELHRRHTAYVITTEHVWVKKGIYQRESLNPTKLEDIDDQDMWQSVHERFFGYGSLELRLKATGDNQNKLLTEVPDVEDVLHVVRLVRRCHTNAVQGRFSESAQQQLQQLIQHHYATKGEPGHARGGIAGIGQQGVQGGQPPQQVYSQQPPGQGQQTQSQPGHSQQANGQHSQGQQIPGNGHQGPQGQPRSGHQQENPHQGVQNQPSQGPSQRNGGQGGQPRQQSNNSQDGNHIPHESPSNGQTTPGRMDPDNASQPFEESESNSGVENETESDIPEDIIDPVNKINSEDDPTREDADEDSGNHTPFS